MRLTSYAFFYERPNPSMQPTIRKQNTEQAAGRRTEKLKDEL
jgi:hypothetical protein